MNVRFSLVPRNFSILTKISKGVLILSKVCNLTYNKVCELFVIECIRRVDGHSVDNSKGKISLF